MANYTDDFSANPGQLSARQNWQRVEGDSIKDLKVEGGVLVRNENGGTTIANTHLFAVPAATHSYAIKWTAVSGTVQVLGMASMVGQFRKCYRFYKQSGRVLLARDNGDGAAGTQLWVTSGPGTNQAVGPSFSTTGFKAEFEPVADGCIIRLYFDGSSTPAITYKDQEAGKWLTSGRPGLFSGSQAALSGELFDDVVTNIPMNELLLTRPAVAFEEGWINPGRVPVAFTYTGTPASIEGRLVTLNPDTLAVIGVAPNFDWATRVASPSGGAGSFTFANVPYGPLYGVEIRDSANPSVVTTDYLGREVGIVGVYGLPGQSQMAIEARSQATYTMTTTVRCYVLRKSTKSVAGSPITLERITTASAHGSGIKAAANRYGLLAQAAGNSCPIVLIDTPVHGQGMSQWLTNGNPGNQGGEDWGANGGYNLWDYTTALLAAVGFRWTFEIWDQGTSNTGAWATYRTDMNSMEAKQDALRSGTAAPFHIVFPHRRSCDSSDPWRLRNEQYKHVLANLGGRWKLGGWQNDLLMDGQGSAHQVTGAAGNIRAGERKGLAIAKFTVAPTLDYLGPKMLSFDMSADRMTIKVAWDRDIKTVSGITTGIPFFHLSVDNGGSYPVSPTALATAITGARETTHTLSSAAPIGQTRIDYMRYTPLNTQTGQPDSVATAEADLEALYFQNVIVAVGDTFDAGRGLPAGPQMLLGAPVALPVTLRATNRTGSTATRIVQPA